MAAETKAKIAGVDEVHQMRAIIADMYDKLDRTNWETSSAKIRRCLWLTDCEDLASHLHNPVPLQVTEPRLSIDLAGLRQLLWEGADGHLYEALEENKNDKILWIDTSAMAVDCMTKKMSGNKMRQLMSTGKLNLNATAESIIAKMKKQKANKVRRLAAAQEKEETSWAVV